MGGATGTGGAPPPNTRRAWGYPRRYLGFWSTGQPSSSRMVHLGAEGVSERPPPEPPKPVPGRGPHSRVGAVGGAELANAVLVGVLPDGHEGGVRLHPAGAAPHALLRVLVVGASHALIRLLGGHGGNVVGSGTSAPGLSPCPRVPVSSPIRSRSRCRSGAGTRGGTAGTASRWCAPGRRCGARGAGMGGRAVRNRIPDPPLPHADGALPIPVLTHPGGCRRRRTPGRAGTARRPRTAWGRAPSTAPRRRGGSKPAPRSLWGGGTVNTPPSQPSNPVLGTRSSEQIPGKSLGRGWRVG